MQDHFLKEEEFSLIEYARHLKMDQPLDQYKKEFWHKLVQKEGYVDIRNFQHEKEHFSKLLPTRNPHLYLQVFKKTTAFEEKLHQLRLKIITTQSILLLLFGLISYILAKSALRPLENSLEMLDSFIKDLIHDLNTPITSIKLNLKILKKRYSTLREDQALERLEQSVDNISGLHENLRILLEEKTFILQDVALDEVVAALVEHYSVLYKNLHFINEVPHSFVQKTHYNAVMQILHNLLSNAAQYNVENGTVRIYTQERRLCIENTTAKEVDVEAIFQRGYSANYSSGLGLDIVKRLANAMHINVVAISKDEKVIFCLEFTKGEDG